MDATDPDRSSGDDITALRLRREHGADLARLATALLDDGATAATAIVEAVITEFVAGNARHRPPPTRLELAERVHLRCRPASTTGQVPPPGGHTYAALVERHQGAAVALYVYGQLSPQRIARLLGIGPRAVCLLLLQDLDGLAGHDRRPLPRRHA